MRVSPLGQKRQLCPFVGEDGVLFAALRALLGQGTGHNQEVLVEHAYRVKRVILTRDGLSRHFESSVPVRLLLQHGAVALPVLRSDNEHFIERGLDEAVPIVEGNGLPFRIDAPPGEDFAPRVELVDGLEHPLSAHFLTLQEEDATVDPYRAQYESLL